MLPDQLGQLFLGQAARSEGVDQHAGGLRHADGVGNLHLALVGQAGRHQVLGHVAGRVGGGPVDLRGVLPGERAAAVAAVTPVGVHDDLAAGQTGIAQGPADLEVAGRVDEDLGLAVDQVGRDHLADHVLGDVGHDLRVLHGRVLGRNHHGVHAGGLAADVLHADLALAVGAQVLDDPLLADAGQFLHQAVGQHDGQGHQLGGLAAGEPEHHSLVPGAARVHTHGDVGGLAVDGHGHPAGIGVQPGLGVQVADLTDGLAGHLAPVHLGLGGDLTGDHHEVAGQKGLAGDPGKRVLLQAGVQDGVRNLVGDLVRVSFGHGFGSEEETLPAQR